MMSLFGRLGTAVTHKILDLPILVLMPHSSCNCRCIMCDIWKANLEKKELTVEDLIPHLRSFQKLNIRRVALSGGEALMHSNLWKFCKLLHSIGVKISLLSTGITLKHHAREVLAHCDDVIVSLDGTKETHNKIRNIPAAFDKLREGVRALKDFDRAFRVTGRTVLQRQNFREFPAIIQTAKAIGLDQISFLGADVSSTAFNRPGHWGEEKISQVALNSEEADELEVIIQKSYADLRGEFDRRFIAEGRDKLLDICRNFRATSGNGFFPSKKCNAPWVSAVVEANGDVMPCFFHPPYGNIRNGNFLDIINSDEAVSFRRKLKVNTDPTCQRCVCSLHLGLNQPV